MVHASAAQRYACCSSGLHAFYLFTRQVWYFYKSKSNYPRIPLDIQGVPSSVCNACVLDWELQMQISNTNFLDRSTSPAHIHRQFKREQQIVFSLKIYSIFYYKISIINSSECVLYANGMENNLYKGTLRRYLLYSIFIWGYVRKVDLKYKNTCRENITKHAHIYLKKANKCYTRSFAYSRYRPCAHT